MDTVIINISSSLRGNAPQTKIEHCMFCALYQNYQCCLETHTHTHTHTILHLLINTQESLGIQKLSCYFWVSQIIQLKMDTVFKNSVDKTGSILIWGANPP